ncbi:MAG: ATP-binding protein [Candidatus Diapherotrites archaeon]|nr:ATP-binding protein [Candidatus Diapherotrites archaeon]
MPEELPWELMRDSLSSFAHDSVAQFQVFTDRLYLVKHYSQNPAVEALNKQAVAVGRSLGAVHWQFSDFRRADNAPANLKEILVQYKRALSRRYEKMPALIARLKAFKRENRNKLNADALFYLDDVIARMQNHSKLFPLSRLGTRVDVHVQPLNIRSFLKRFAGERFVNRDGKPVQVIFRGKDLGSVNFDRSLLYRGLYNLVTDALNHSPGRPIFVTLSRKNGHAAINVTNQGPKLMPEEIVKIGRVRFTRAWHDPKRGYGKISTRLLTEAQGGSFRAGNSRIGPMLSIRLPLRRRVA